METRLEEVISYRIKRNKYVERMLVGRIINRAMHYKSRERRNVYRTSQGW